MVVIKRQKHHLYVDKVVHIEKDLYVVVGMYKARCISCSLMELPIRLSESEVEELKRTAVPNDGRERKN